VSDSDGDRDSDSAAKAVTAAAAVAQMEKINSEIPRNPISRYILRVSVSTVADGIVSCYGIPWNSELDPI